MKIGINAITINNQKTGIGTYTYQVLKNLLLIDHKNEYTVFVPCGLSFEFHADNLKIEYIKSNINNPYYQLFWENISLPNLLNKKKIDILFSPSFTLPILPYLSKSIITVHDLSFLLFPKTKSYLFRNYMKYILPNSIKKANFIICDSASTYNDLLKYYYVSSKKINIIHLGCNGLFFKKVDDNHITEFKRKYNCNKNYLLYVGSDDPRKNIPRIMQAFKLFKKEDKQEYQLILVGKGKRYVELLKLAKALDLENEIKFIDYLNEKELHLAYLGAKLLIYTSIYEGFGLPILEAMTCGVPVLTSNRSSMAEIAGDGAYKVDPYNTENIYTGIKLILEDGDLRKELIQNGFQRSGNFSWRTTAQKTLKVFELVSKTNFIRT